MLQESSIKKIKITLITLTLLFVLSIGAAVFAAYLNTNRDTRKPPAKVETKLPITGYELLCTKGNYEYYFRDDRDIIAIRDKNSGYVWKTGIDAPFNNQISDAKEAIEEGKVKEYAEEQGITEKQVKELAKTPEQDSFNHPTHLAMANSLITVMYYPGEGDSLKEKATPISSAAEEQEEGYSNPIIKLNDDGSQWKLECLFTIEDKKIGINVYITFGEDGTINYKVPYEEITGENISKIASIVIAPYMGASGGKLVKEQYNEENEEMEEISIWNEGMPSGYALIPDGSGSLIRFEKNAVEFTEYEGKVYGNDPSTNMFYYDSLGDTVPVKNPVMPVFGISHGDGTQAAFVAYADDGDEYMTINVATAANEQNKIKYTRAYAKFNYNVQYFYVTNQAGAGYRTIQETPNKFDIDFTYQLLSGDGSDGTPAADYTGMAQAYREHLIEKGILTEKVLENTSENEDIPIRIDFLMSDSKKGVFSTQQVTVTTTDDVKNILNTLEKDGIKNINSGIIGWQSGGETLAKPTSTSVSSDVGGKKGLKAVIDEFQKKNIDISLSRDFVSINESMMSYYKNSARHLNTKYLLLDKSTILPKNVPVTEYGYADPNKTAEWINDLNGSFEGYGNSFTIDGASNTLISTYTNDGDNTTADEVISLYQNTLKGVRDKGTKLNLVSPNQYLWKYTDRYLQAPVGTSQYVYETDTVPFLQMVLHGTMEVYAPYSNFSFYSQKDMLKMIDYNISPSFVLTQEPSYLLAATTSADFYSTEFSQYEEIIKNIYSTVNTPLSIVSGYKWDSRTVIEDGVIANEYSKDGNIKTIVINYTEDEVKVSGTKIAPLSAQVIEGGVK